MQWRRADGPDWGSSRRPQRLRQTEDVTTVGDDVADIDADAKLGPIRLWHVGIAFDHAPLDVKRTALRVHDANIAESLYYSWSKEFRDIPLLVASCHQTSWPKPLRSSVTGLCASG
jgi:hypothetical protein